MNIRGIVVIFTITLDIAYFCILTTLYMVFIMLIVNIKTRDYEKYFIL